MKKFIYLLLFSLIVIFHSTENGFAQCNIQASICTPGTAGPFNFVGTGGALAGGSYAAGSCATGNGGLGNDFAFITLNITTSGPLELLVDGNTTGGFLDVIIFDIPDGVAPCDAILDANNEIACNFANAAGGCVQIGTAFPCGSSIPAPNVTAGDEVMIIVHDWSNANNTFTLDLSPGGAQTGPPDATIAPVATVCSDDPAFNLNAVNNGGTWSGPGVNASGLFNPAAAGIGTHTINYNVGSAPCTDQDQTTIEVIDCNTCLITYFEANANLEPCSDTWEIDGIVEFTTPPAVGDLIFEDCDGNQTVIASAPFANPGLINYTHTGPLGDLVGGNCDFTVYFSADPLCTQMVTINLPPITPPDEAGTVTPNLTGNALNNYILCDGDVLDITSDDNWSIPPIAPGNDPGLVYSIYTCPPTPGGVGIDPGADPCLAGFITSEDIALLNDGGDADPLLNSIGIGAGDEFYIVPMTLGSVGGLTYQADCYDLAIDQMVTATYLNPILTTQVQDCQAGTATVTINGGMPEFNGSQFTASNLAPGSATFDNTTAGNGGTITISGLVDGDNWSFDIVDDNGCPISVSGTFIGVEDPSFSYPDNVYCESQLDPSANITGTPGGTFTVNPGGLTIDANSGLIDLSSATGTYTITYTTPDPICFDTEDFIITINPEPIINPLANQEECGSYTLPPITGTNLTGNEAYFDAPNGGGTQFNPGDAITTVGTTTLYIFDETGTVPNCFNETSFDVTINSSPILDPLANQIECDSYTLPAITGTNLTGGEAYFTGAAGTGTQLNPGDVINTAGTTTLFIYDETGTVPNCFDEQTFDVTINLTPVIDPLADQVICDSYTLPAITGTNLTGNQAYFDAPNGGGTQYNAGDAFTNVGTTTLYIYDETATAPNCFDETSFDVTINLTPVIDPLADQIICDSYTLPAITGTNLTGNEAYYDAPNGAGTQLNVGDVITAAGTTTLYIYDETATAPNCFDEETFDVTINITPIVDPLADQVECDSYTLPAITGTNLTGNEAYYDAPNGGGTQLNAGDNITTAGTTTLYIYDETATAPNCFDEETFDVTINITPTFALASTDPTVCGGADGTITLSGLESNTAYDVTYSDGGGAVGPVNMTSDAAGNIVIGGLTSGSYSDFVVTLNGCTTIDNTSINLIEPNAPAVNAGTDQEVCAGTAVTLTANNPDGAAITWNNGVTDGNAFTPNVGVNNFTVTADLAGCISTDQVTVTVYAVPVIDPLANQEECDSYTLPAITGTDLTGNEAYYDATNGGGTQYNPGDVISTAGTTTLFIYDETGTVPNCFNEQTFDVTINLTPIIDPLANQEECDSYTLPAITGTNLTGNEAYYDAPNGGGTQYNAGDAFTTAGTTTLYIYDETATTPNCFNEQSFDVTINLTPVIDPLADQEACDSYTLPAITGTNLTGNEAYYDAPNGGGTQYNAGDNISTAGTTTLYIYDETATTPNCFNEQTFDVIINITPVVDPLADQVECDSYTLPVITGTNLTGNEAYYDAPNGGGTQYNAGDNITTAGTTTLYIYDETATTPNCFNEQTFDVTINITPTFTLASSDPTACGAADGTITLSGLEPNTAYDITYSDGGAAVGPANMNSDAAGDLVIGGLTAGSYSDFVVTLNGCTATDNSSINLVDPNAPAIDAGADQEICEGGDVTLTANNPDGATISWDNGVTDGTVFNPAVGTVTYTVTADLLGCISTDQVDVIVHPNPIVSAGNDVTICEGESVTLTGSGANSYVWDNGVTDGVTFSPSSTQTYTVVGTSAEGCVGTDDVTVTIEPLPVVSFEANNLEGCVPVTVTFTNTSSVAGTDCTWNFGDGSTATGCGQVTHTFNSVGCFDVTLEVTSANGCTSSSTLADYICVGGYPNAAFNFSPDQLTNINNQAQFSNSSTGAVSYEWSFGDGQTSTEVNPSHDFPAVADSFNVQLVATSPFGCTDTANAIVPIIEELIFYVPNTFTPDNDDFNEVFKPIFTSGFDPFDYNLLIFNRWGEIVFESNDSEVGWDGTYGAASEDLVKDGTYVWKITFKTKINDERIVETGHVNLLK